ncbi:hypothetical protein [Shimia sp.]|uniref:hypothetical protein n=1 Tax=Shimia sp. TaxID=1954381 RepID=UPI003BAC5134
MDVLAVYLPAYDWAKRAAGQEMALKPASEERHATLDFAGASPRTPGIFDE